ncbi:unnamed protein product [Rhizoctonia solani]|uniref:Uncharacterized protein n=1 Tax=Rhizoctonia solani TaxID=456999 RepID=A0A8H2Y076_9AGAM|nr:unnamed protein product [Rhizoctonia solani]
MAKTCEIDEAKGQGNPWYAGRTGWIISAAFVLALFLITCINVSRHARNYRAPKEQRQIMRILYMPLVYGSVSWLSYRFIDEYVYISLVFVIYEALALSAFLYLMIQYVANSAESGSVEEILSKKDKARLPPPWLVFQFIIIRPTMSIISIVCHALNVLCPSSMSLAHPNFWLSFIDIQSMVTAMFGLLLFYRVNRQELNGHRPLLKFTIVKIVVAVSVIQEFVFKLLRTSGTIKATENWSATHVADGLTAFALTIEMTFISIAMAWAYSASEYFTSESPKGTVTQALIDSINFGDFITEMKRSLVFFYTRSRTRNMDQLESLGVNELTAHGSTSHNSSPLVEMSTRVSKKGGTEASGSI